MGGIAFEADDLGGDRDLVLRVFGDGEVHLCRRRVGSVPRQIDERAVRADVLGQSFLDDFFAVLVLPPDANRKRDQRVVLPASICI